MPHRLATSVSQNSKMILCHAQCVVQKLNKKKEKTKMKKLMFMLAAVVMAAGVQAASVNWTCTDVYAGNESDTVSGVAYFLTTDMLAYSTAQALAGKGAGAITTALGSAYSYSGSDGKFSVKAADAVANASLGLTGGTPYSAYLMIFDSESITDDSKFYLTETKSFTALVGDNDSVKVSWGSQFDNTKTAGAWSSASAVPEPTSGLLMLVGLAGLALRRRRA